VDHVARQFGETEVKGIVRPVARRRVRDAAGDFAEEDERNARDSRAEEDRDVMSHAPQEVVEDVGCGEDE